MRKHIRTRALIATAIAITLPAALTRAGTTWDGGDSNDNNWTSPNNWSPNGAPANDGSASIHFTGSTRTSPDLDTDWSIQSLTFDASAASFNLGSLNSHVLTIGIIGINQASAADQSIDNPIKLGASQIWTSTSGILFVTGPVNTNGNVLTVNAAHEVDFSLISGSGGFTKTGSAVVTMHSAAANTYTGTTTVNSGTLQLEKNGVNAINGDLVIGNGSSTDIVTLLDNDQIAETVGNTITINSSGLLDLGAIAVSDTVRDINFVGGEISIGSGSTLRLAGALSSTATSPEAQITGAGTFRMNGNKTFNIADGAASIDLNIDTVVGDDGGGRILTKSGAGTLRLGKANTFGGGLTLSAGTLILDNSSAAGTGTLTLAGGTLESQTTVNVANSVDVSGATTVMGLSASTLITFSGLLSGSGSLTIDDADQAAVALKLTGGFSSMLSGTVTVNQGNLRLNKAAAGIDAIAGDLVIGDGVGAASTAKVFQERSDQINNASNVTVKQDGFWFAVPSSSESINSLVIEGGGQVNLGTGTLDPGSVTVNVGDGTPALIQNPISLGGGFTTIDVVTGAELVLAGNVASGGIIKNGGGTLRFSFSNSFSSGVTMNVGTIALDVNGAPLGTGTVHFANGTIAPVNAGRSISNLFILTGPGTIDCEDFGLTLSGAISGTGSLSKIGTSLLTLTNSANTYSGATTVFAGTLAVGNSGLGSAAGGTSVAIGATLQLTASYANAEPLTLNSAGSANGGGGALVANMPPGGGSFAGAITNSLNATIASIGGDFTLRGNINTGGSAVTITGSGNTIVAALMTGNGSLFKAGSATLTLTSANTYTGFTSVSAGRLLIQNNLTASSSVSVTAGTIELATGGGHNRVIHTGSLSVTGTGRVDLQDNKLITSSPVGVLGSGNTYTGVTGLIQSGRNGGEWNGSHGIVTSQTDATTSNFTTLGVARASDVRPATATITALWAGQTITGTDVLVMYTYGGDANLDGKLNIDDYVRIDSGIASHLTGWSNGDFNYDGKVNIDDYTTAIDANIANQSGVFPTSGRLGNSVTAIPEPTAVDCLVAGSLIVSVKRRRRGLGVCRDAQTL